MAEACVCRNLFVELKRAESVCFLFKCMNVLNFRASDIGVFSWHYLFLFSPVYQCVTFHALATVIAFRRTLKVSTRHVMYSVGCNKTEIKELSLFLTKKHWWRPLLIPVFVCSYTICLFHLCLFRSLSYYFNFIIRIFDSNFFLQYQVANQLYHKMKLERDKMAGQISI